MKIKTILLALATAALIPVIAQAEPNGERPEGKGKRPNPAKMVERHDTDSNGSISKEEAPERMLEHFDKIDSNADGEITAEELKAAAKARRGKKGDKDKDGESI